MKEIRGRGHPDFYKYLESMRKLHDEKNEDYTKGGDSLGNFHRVSAILKIWGYDVPPWLVAAIYALKQQDAGMWMLSQGYEGKIEGVDKRWEDKGVYSILERILIKEERGKKKANKT